MALLSEHTLTTTDAFVTRQIDTPEDFRAMEGPWRELFAASACPSVFSSWEWVSEWCAHFIPILCCQGTPASAVLLAVYDRKNQLIGVTAFIEIRTPYSLIGERRLIQIGLVCSYGTEPEEPVLLCLPGRQTETLHAIREYLTTRRSDGRWNHFTMQSYHSLGVNAESVPGSHPQSFWQQFHTNSGPLTVALPPTWEAFRARLGKSLRHNLPYYRRRLTRTGRAWAVRVLQTPSEIESIIPRLAELHKRRAESTRGRPHMDHLPTLTHTDFLSLCLPLLAERGLAFVAALEVEGVPIAAQVFLQSGGVLTFYYSGFDPDWHEFSPITIIGERIIQHAISLGMSKINFLSEELPWKTRWRAQPEGVCQVLVGFSPHPVSLAYAAIRRGYRKRHILEVELSGFTKDGVGGRPGIRPKAMR